MVPAKWSGGIVAEYGRRGVVGMGLAGAGALALGGCDTDADVGRSFRELHRVRSREAGDPDRSGTPRQTHAGHHHLLGPLSHAVLAGGTRAPAPQDRPIWIHGVMTVDPPDTRALAEASSGKADLLPGIYPDLRQYVPEDKVFTTVPKEDADEILDIEHMMQDDPSRFESSNTSKPNRSPSALTPAS